MKNIVQDLNLNIDDIPSEQMQMVADRCGMPDAISLMLNVPGLELYVPISGKKTLAVNYIKSNFTGQNSASLAVKLGIDNKKVKKIIRKYSSIDTVSVLRNDSMMVVAEKCGEDTAIHLIEEFPLHTIYVPKNGFSISIRKYIERNFNGYNQREIALKCHVTERHVRQVISDMYASTAQLSLDLPL